MCGIFGIIVKDNDCYGRKIMKDIFLKIAEYSEVRGNDSSGIVFRNLYYNKYEIIRGPIPISNLLSTKEFKTKMLEYMNNYDIGMKNNINYSQCGGIAIIGHARLATNGTHLKDINNQPVVKDGLIAIHNGIIVNVNELWNTNKDIKRLYDIDTEVMLSLFRKYLTIFNDTKHALIRTIKDISGTIATAIMIADRNEIVLSTNNGSLYTLTDDNNIVVFASELFILEKALKNTKLNRLKSEIHLNQLKPQTGKIIYLKEFQIVEFSYTHLSNNYSKSLTDVKYEIDIVNMCDNKRQTPTLFNISLSNINPKADYEKRLLEYKQDRISKLRRCKRCLLPETFPFIIYDNEGICNVCRNYKPHIRSKSIDQLMELVKPYRSYNNEPDCIVPYSGGRDSTYALHIIKTMLHLNPITFTYDWGMVTDLARRNIARVCGKLGIENIIVSAGIQWKRENIRKNIMAWLKNPNLGMIPLFMAGDKFFFYYTSKIKKQTGIKLNIWGTNPLENTDFKVGFCGIPLRFNKKNIYSLKIIDQIKLFKFVGKCIINNPAYINQSLFDTLGSFASRYLSVKKDIYHIYDYYKWDEKEIEELLIDEYKWETAVDTKSTWRIGDGTSAFYNYVYYTVAGFSEYDTFRSNQVREGMLEREEALSLVYTENRPRYESIKWYTEILGLDYGSVIKKINAIPKMY